MIYAIQAVNTDFIKFGVASGVERRLVYLQTGCPFELVLVAVADWPAGDEALIHRYLHASRVRGEWFSRGGQVETVVSSIAVGDRPAFLRLIAPPRAPGRLARVLEHCGNVAGQHRPSVRAAT